MNDMTPMTAARTTIETTDGQTCAPTRATDALGEAHILTLPDAAATERFGEDLALALKPGDLVALLGEIGSGKSTLARALIRALAGNDALDVPSPTFTLAQSYAGRLPVAHLDLYRLADASEAEELGIEEALETGTALVEWAGNAPEVLARATIVVELAGDPENDGRRLAIAARGSARQRVARTLEIRQTFLADPLYRGARRRHFTGDASSRRYETLHEEGDVTVLMDAPRQPDGPPIRDGLPYSQLVHLAEDVVPFVAIAQTLRAAGLTAPVVLKSDCDRGLLLTSHLGAETILDAAGAPDPCRYRAVAECLATLHEKPWDPCIALDGGIVHQVPTYDARAMMIEAELLLDWYAPRELGRTPDADETALFKEAWSAIFAELADAETSLVLRDVHSPNIIWQRNAIGVSRIGFIDFQDAMIGPAAYDLASLAQDARVDVPPELEAALVAAYIAARRRHNPGFDPFALERDYAIMAAQRASKILGIFVRLNDRDGKPQYLRHIPRVKAYLWRTLEHPSLAGLKPLYADWGLAAPS